MSKTRHIAQECCVLHILQLLTINNVIFTMFCLNYNVTLVVVRNVIMIANFLQYFCTQCGFYFNLFKYYKLSNINSIKFYSNVYYHYI
jgi:hypothetical protein